MRHPFRTALYLLLDSFLLIASLVNTTSVANRPGVPFEVLEIGGHVTIGTILDHSAAPELKTGDLLLAWEGKPVPIAELVEYLTDCLHIGDNVRVIVRHEATDMEMSIRLIPYYHSLRFLVISLFVGVAVFGVGIFILIVRPEDQSARSLHWALVTLGATVMNTWGAVDASAIGSTILRSMWFISYIGAAVSFLYFTWVFPSLRFPRLTKAPWLIAIAVIAAGTAFAAFQLSAMATGSTEKLLTFQSMFDVFHASLIIVAGAGQFNIAQRTLQAANSEERRKMYWVLWGLLIGAVPYLVFHILPQLLFSQYFVPEEFTTIFFLAVPFGFAVAVLKYRLFDVEVMINRTIVYGVLSFFIVIAYALIVLLVASVIGEEVVFEKYFAVAALTLVIGLVVNPLRLKLLHVVDQTLFTARADFRRAMTGAERLLQGALNKQQLLEYFVNAVHGVVPADAVVVYEVRGADLVRAAFFGPEPAARLTLDSEIRSELRTREIVLQSDAVRTDQWPVSGTALEWPVYLPLRSQANELVAVVVMRPRLAREKYDEDEIAFLLSAAAQASEILERLTLQENMILAQEERRRLEELSELKSYFISSVSHELRMPLTSIRMFAEMLRMQRTLSPRQKHEYLGIIEGESGRLSRLIGNILDFAKVERGTKEYEFREVRMDQVVKRALLAMRYEALQQKARLRVRIQRGVGLIWADPDALEEAVLNLLSNALKYSTRRKEIDVNVFRKHGTLSITVADKGIGIPESELPSIFDRFYRVRDDRTRQVGGAGIGLAVVKHVVEAHHGKVSVQSVLGQGTSFRIELPVHGKHPRGKS